MTNEKITTSSETSTNWDSLQPSKGEVTFPEEALKQDFDERFDGIVYAVYVSLGFAFVENVLYIYQDVGQAVSIARARAFFAVPAHTLFAIAMGYGAGIARFSRKRASLYLVSGLIWAILLHGIYDFLLMYSNELASVNETFSAFIVMLFYIFVIIMWVVGFRRMKKLNEEDQWRL